MRKLYNNLTPQQIDITINTTNVNTSFGYIKAVRSGNIIVVSVSMRVQSSIGTYGGMAIASGLPIPFEQRIFQGSALSKDGTYASCVLEIGANGTLYLDSRYQSVSSGDTFLGQMVYVCQ